MYSIELQILTRIKKAKGGVLFFSDSFAAIAGAKTVLKALERLTAKGEIKRVATGIYVRPAKDKILGIVMPGVDEIALAMAKRDKAKIIPTV